MDDVLSPPQKLRLVRHLAALLLPPVIQHPLGVFEINSRPISVPLEQVQQMASVQESDRFPLRKLIGILPILSSRYQNPFCGPLIDYRPVKIAHGRDPDDIRVTLRLYHDLPTPNRIRIERYCINASVTARLSHPHLSTSLRKFLFK